jgi:N-acetylglucosaminyldiphosphoundecaprenol N-acetyl-beta-D-mannosaminyltransferase
MKKQIKVTRFSNLSFVTGTFSEVSAFLAHRIKLNKSQLILPCSLNDLANIAEKPQLASAYQAIDFCTTDGMPLVWLLQFHLRQKIERVYGPDLMVSLCQKLSAPKTNHVLFGASSRVLQKLKKQMLLVNPQLQIKATISPPMKPLSPKKEVTYLKQIKKLKPAVLWIGLSSPLQVELAARWKKHLPHTTILCVGAAFDFVAGQKKVAPAWMKKNGLEWLFRLITEPKRLWKRYLIVIPKFLLFHGSELFFNPRIGL